MKTRGRRLKFPILLYLMVIATLYLCSNVIAQDSTYYSQATANFSILTNWKTLAENNPSDLTSGDNFVIQTDHTITLDVSTALILSLTIESGGTFLNSTNTIQIGEQSGSGGLLDIAGTYTAGSGTILFFRAGFGTPSYTIQSTQAEIFNNISFSDGNGTLTLNKASSPTVNFTINGTLKIGSNAGAVSLNNTAIVYGDNSKIEYTPGTNYAIGPEWTSTIDAASVTINSSGNTISVPTGTGEDRTIGKTLTLTAGTLSVSNNNSLTVLGDIASSDIAGSGSVTTSGTGIISMGDGTTQNSQTVTGSPALSNLTIDKTGSGTANDVTVSGSPTITNDLTITDGDLIINGGITISSGDLNVDGGSVTNNGFLTVSGGTNKISVAASASFITGTGATSITTVEIELASGASYSTGGKTITSLTTLTLDDNSTFEFNGTGGAETTPLSSATFGNINMNNGGGLNINGSVTVNGTITFSVDGTINVSGSNTLTLGASAGAIATANANRYINGPVTKSDLSGSFDFPIGDGSAYRPTTINVTSGEDHVTVQYETTDPDVATDLSGTIKNISDNRKWTITPGASVSIFNVTLEYASPGFTIGNENNMRILRGTSNVDNWIDADTSPTVDTGNNLVTATGLTTTTPVNFTVAEAIGSYTWSGLDPGNNNVNDPDNWTGGVIPGAGDDVTIGTGTADINVATTWGTATINGGATVNITVDATPALTLDDGSSAAVLSVSGFGTSLNATPSTLTTAGQIIRLNGQGEISVSSQASIVFSNSNNTGIEDGTGSPLATSRQSYASGTSYTWNADGSAFQSQTYGNLILNPTNAINVAGFTVTNAMQINGQTITISSGTLTIGENLAVNAGTFSPAADVDLSGNLSVAGTLSASSGTFTFEGSTGQQGISGGGTVTFNNLDMNNGDGLGLSRDITISNSLNFSADGLITTGSNTLTIGSGGSASGASGSRYISGRAAKVFPTGSSSFTFPTGKGGEYLPLTMQLGSVSGSTVTVTVEQQNTTPPNHTSVSGLTHISTIRYWDLTRSVGGTVGSHQVTLTYNENDAVDTNRLSLRVAQWNSTNWVSLGGQGTGVPTGTIASTSMTGFGAGYVTFGDAVGDNSLPVELTSFKAKASYDKVLISWITESELQNEGFNIYRRDVKEEDDWRLLSESMIPGQGNTSEKTVYEFVDRSVAAGQTYEYMLESISYAGVRVQEKVIEVLVPIPTEYTTLGNYPNPFNPTTNIGFRLPETSEVSILIYGIQGNLVRELALNQSFEAGDHFVTWDATDNSGQQVASGMYVYLFTTGNFKKTEKMLLLK